MVSEWSVRPIHNLIYRILKSKLSRKSRGFKGYILYNELKYIIIDRFPNFSEEEIRKALLDLEIWGKISVENNGNDLEIRLRENSGEF